MAKNIAEINNFLQYKLRKENFQRVPIKVAAEWLNDYGYLSDSKTSPGYPLRRLIKSNLIMGAVQENNFYWYIEKVENYREILGAKELQEMLGLKTINSVYKKIREQNIPFIRLNNKRVVFYKDEVLNWLLKNNHKLSFIRNAYNQPREELYKIKESLN